MKYLRQWLEHRQRSVFAGFLTQAQLNSMKSGLLKLIRPNVDSVIIFQSNQANQVGEWCTHAADRQRLESIVIKPEIQKTKPEPKRDQVDENDATKSRKNTSISLRF
jgi:CRISPR/Cas system-associated endoribonuclease Cas2